MYRSVSLANALSGLDIVYQANDEYEERKQSLGDQNTCQKQSSNHPLATSVTGLIELEK